MDNPKTSMSTKKISEIKGWDEMLWKMPKNKKPWFQKLSLW